MAVTRQLLVNSLTVSKTLLSNMILVPDASVKLLLQCSFGKGKGNKVMASKVHVIGSFL